MRFYLLGILSLLLTGFAASAQSANKVTVHGSVKSDILFPQDDYKIGTQKYDSDVLTNTYASASLFSRYIDAGLRFEYLQHPLPGYEQARGWGIPNIFLKVKGKGVEFTAGDFYEQFGSGFILRCYEERSLGIDNSIRGGRLKINALRGFRFTALGGVQRRYWDWDIRSQLYGADVEWDASTSFKSLADRNIVWTFGGSYVLKHERDEEKLIAGTNARLNFPKNVSAFDVRTHFYRTGLDLLGEFAWKSQDPSFVNHYTYAHGNAAMVSASYARSGWSGMLQAKRSDNMDFRSERSESEAVAFINNLPVFTYQETRALASLYPYATQAAPGEWAFQADLAYNARRGTTLGGKYGTKFRLNASYICAIDREAVADDVNQLAGTDWWKTSWGGFGQTYFSDISFEVEKKFTRDFTFNFTYVFQKYNKTAVEGHGGMINSNIFLAEGKYRFSNRLTLRAELQYLQTRDDQKDWAYGLVELSVAPYLMFSISDMWNNGDTKLHYYLATATATYRNNRLLIGYGRTRAGFNCAGGVCRYLPATRGFQIAYSYHF